MTFALQNLTLCSTKLTLFPVRPSARRRGVYLNVPASDYDIHPCSRIWPLLFTAGSLGCRFNISSLKMRGVLQRVSSMDSAFSIAAPEAVLSNTHQLSNASSFENDLISSSV